MVPLVSISHLITLPFLAYISIRLYSSFKKTKDKNVGYFFAVFLILSIMEALLAMPGLVSSDLLKISAIFAFYPFFIISGLGFLGVIPLGVMQKRKAEIFFLSAIFVSAILATIINLNNINPAPAYYNHPFVYWEDTRGKEMNIFIGIFSAVILLFVIYFFFLKGIKSSERHIKIRSFLISGGVASLFSAAVINFVFGAILHQYITSLISAFFIIASSIFIFIGVRYKI